MRQTKGQMGSQQRIWEKCQKQGQRRLKTGGNGIIEETEWLWEEEAVLKM